VRAAQSPDPAEPWASKATFESGGEAVSAEGGRTDGSLEHLAGPCCVSAGQQPQRELRGHLAATRGDSGLPGDSLAVAAAAQASELRADVLSWIKTWWPSAGARFGPPAPFPMRWQTGSAQRAEHQLPPPDGGTSQEGSEAGPGRAPSAGGSHRAGQTGPGDTSHRPGRDTGRSSTEESGSSV